MEFDETEREKKKRLEEEARKIKEKIKQELKTQEAGKTGEKRKAEDNSDSEVWIRIPARDNRVFISLSGSVLLFSPPPSAPLFSPLPYALERPGAP